jgi:hypothetical protein
MIESSHFQLPAVPEADIQRQILQYLGLRHFCWRNNTGGFRNKRDHFYQFGKVGSGDILGVKKPTGQFFSIEVKKKGKKPTDHQIEFMGKVQSAGGIAFVAYSVDDVIRAGL